MREGQWAVREGRWPWEYPSAPVTYMYMYNHMCVISSNMDT